MVSVQLSFIARVISLVVLSSSSQTHFLCVLKSRKGLIYPRVFTLGCQSLFVGDLGYVKSLTTLFYFLSATQRSALRSGMALRVKGGGVSTDGSPTRDRMSGWRSSGSTVSVGGAHPGKTPGPLARHSHHRIRFTNAGRLTANCRRQLKRDGLHHHVLVRSFP